MAQARQPAAPAAPVQNVLRGNIRAEVPVNVTPAGSRPWVWWTVGGVAAAVALGFLFFSVTHVTDEGRIASARTAAAAEVSAREAAIRAATDAAVAKATAEVAAREVAIRKAAEEAANQARADAATRDAAIRQAAADARAEVLARAPAAVPAAPRRYAGPTVVVTPPAARGGVRVLTAAEGGGTCVDFDRNKLGVWAIAGGKKGCLSNPT